MLSIAVCNASRAARNTPACPFLVAGGQANRMFGAPPPSHTCFGSSTSATCVQYSPNMLATTTIDDLTAPATFTHAAANLNHKRIARRPVLGGLINEYERVA
jgi:hypothetical protein